MRHQAPAVTAMEYVYFARPDPARFGQNVHATRKRAGRLLAQEAPAQADMVLGYLIVHFKRYRLRLVSRRPAAKWA